MNWKRYQVQAAEVFQKAGCKSEVEAKVVGARGEHKIDVYVTFEQYGVNCSWVVECKYWNTNVPKEKVLALQSIVDDVGADRGILISKTGFQSGAIRSAHKSNITLTSLEDLIEDLEKDATKIAVESLESSLLHTKHKMHSLSTTKKMGPGHWSGSYPDGISGKEVMNLAGKLCIFESGFENIKLGKKVYPMRFSDCGNKIETTDSIEEFLSSVKDQISVCTLWLSTIM